MPNSRFVASRHHVIPKHPNFSLDHRPESAGGVVIKENTGCVHAGTNHPNQTHHHDQDPHSLLNTSSQLVHSNIVSLNVIDSMMCSTNGFIGVNHKSETQTALLRSQVKVNGVYHRTPQVHDVPSVTLPLADEVGALLCTVDICAYMDGQPCRLLDMQPRTLSLEDGAYRSLSRLASPCGHVSFDMHYTRFASFEHIERWVSELKCTNFHFSEDEFERGGYGSVSQRRPEHRFQRGSRQRAASFRPQNNIDSDGGDDEDDEETDFASPSQFLSNQFRTGDSTSTPPSPVSGEISDPSSHLTTRMSSPYAASPLPRHAPPHSDTPLHRQIHLDIVVEVRFATDQWNIAPESTLGNILVQSKTSGICVLTQSNVMCSVTSGDAGEMSPVEAATTMPRRNGKAPSLSGKTGGGHSHLPALYALSSSETDPAHPADGGASTFVGAAGRGFPFDMTQQKAFMRCFQCMLDAHRGPQQEVVVAFSAAHTPVDGEATIHASFFDRDRSPGDASLSSPPLFRSETSQHFSTAVDPPASSTSSSITSSRFVFDVELLLAKQREKTSQFWNSFDIELLSQDEVHVGRLSLGLRYNAFMTFCVGRAAQYGIARGGMSAQGSSMQYSFQSYLYLGLMYIYTDPECARGLFRHIHGMLPKAIENARRMSISHGALYPHTTITGQECGPHVLNRSSRFHINADLAHIIFLYLDAVRNVSWEEQRPLTEILIQTARVWLQIGYWEKDEITFRIDGVCGPDEYNGLVDGNFYTTLAAKQQILRTCAYVKDLRSSATTKDKMSALLEALDISLEELEELHRAGDGLVLHRDDKRMVYFAHEVFDSLAPYPKKAAAIPLPPQATGSGMVGDDATNTEGGVQQSMPKIASSAHSLGGQSAESYSSEVSLPMYRQYEDDALQYPLSHNYHPLFIYRTKLCEIPDVLLGMLLHPSVFERADLQRNFLYYAPYCTHDTPESLGITAAVALRAFGDFSTDANSMMLPLILHGLDNVANSAEDGLHLAAMAASWISVTHGLGGMHVTDGTMHLKPVLPPGLERVSFTLQRRGSVMRTTITPANVEYELLRGEHFRFIHEDTQRIHLHRGYHGVEANTHVSFPRAVTQQVCTYFDGVIFTMDALVANLLDLNFTAWEKVLGPFLEARRLEMGQPLKDFSLDEFIEKMVYQEEAREAAYSGLHEVLLTRGIDVPLGSSDDSELTQTRFGLANKKVEELKLLLNEKHLELVPGAVSLILDLKKLGVRVGLVSYTRSMYDMLKHFPELEESFLATIDGTEAREKHIRGRPHTDLFVKAAQKMHLPPSRCVVVATHLDQGYTSRNLSEFFMFLNVEEKRSWEYRQRRGSGMGSGSAQSSPRVMQQEQQNQPQKRTLLQPTTTESNSNTLSLLSHPSLHSTDTLRASAVTSAVGVDPGSFPRSTAELEDLALSQFQRAHSDGTRGQ